MRDHLEALRRTWRDGRGSNPRLMAGLMAGLLVVYGAWQVTGWPPGHTELISDLSFVPVSLAAAVTAYAASLRCPPASRMRSAWRLIALAVLSYLLGDLAWMVYAMLGDRPYPSAADGFYLCFYPLLLAGLLRLSSRRADRHESALLGIDMAVVALAGSVVVVYLVLGPTLVAGGSDTLETVFSVAYPIGDMILLFGLSHVLLRGDSSIGPSLGLIAAGLICFVAADLAYGYITLHGTYKAGNPVDTLWLVAFALFAVAASAQPRINPVLHPLRPAMRSASWLPYVALAIACGLLIWDSRHETLFPRLTLALAVVCLTALVSLRQFLTNRALIGAQRQLVHDSLHDGLTGLCNRVLLLDRAEHMLARARRDGTKVAALYLDVDDFKLINDTYGHSAGDGVLCAVADRLTHATRAVDTVGRLGGDEFLILLDAVRDEGDARRVAMRIDDLMAPPIMLQSPGARPVSVSLSIGIAVTSSQGTDALLHDADVALYEVKRSGKHGWSQFAAGSAGRRPSTVRLRSTWPGLARRPVTVPPRRVPAAPQRHAGEDEEPPVPVPQ